MTIEIPPQRRHPSRIIGPVLLACLLFGPWFFRQHAMIKMGPPLDLRRVYFPSAGLTVAEHGAGDLLIVTDEWMVTLQSVDAQAAESIRGTHRGILTWSPDGREDVLQAPGSPKIYQLLRGLKGSDRAVQIQFVIEFEDGWAHGGAFARQGLESVDVPTIDNFLFSLRLADQPRLDAEVPPAWRTYQRTRVPGSPIAKFELSMDPAPVVLGNEHADTPNGKSFTTQEYQQGGRQIAADLLEFYGKDDGPSIRVDLWTEDPPRVEGRERIFEGTLRIDHPVISIRSFAHTYQAPLATGLYDVSVTLVNRGKDSEAMLTEAERFARADLARYEVRLKKRPD